MRLGKILIAYFAAAGLVAHLLAGGLLLARPDLVQRGLNKLMVKLPWQPEIPQGPLSASDLIHKVGLPSWQPSSTESATPGEIRIGSLVYPSLSTAADALSNGDTLLIGPGVYPTAMVIRADDVTIRGLGHVAFEGKTAEGKAALVIKGDRTRVENIECRQISVRDQNGACIRLEGSDLEIHHSYFHDAENGVLTGRNPGRVLIDNSRFERLGKRGQAHGIYIGGGELHIRDSQFLQSVDEGHEVKSRASRTFIERSIIASLDGRDSRLIDVPNGGVLIVTDSILAQGRASSNADLIGYGLEGRLHTVQSVQLSRNLVLLERPAGNQLLHMYQGAKPAQVDGNIIVGTARDQHQGVNFWFESRQDAGIADYPALPSLPKD